VLLTDTSFLHLSIILDVIKESSPNLRNLLDVSLSADGFPHAGLPKYHKSRSIEVLVFESRSFTRTMRDTIESLQALLN
jgi:hypothetical protein